jgi:pimeloyl-ACP methyl ester carboxylesterase
MSIRFETAPHFFIAATAYGNPSNLPVLLLHGGGQTSHSWGDTARILAENGYYAIALDARGHGDSSWSVEADYLTDAMVFDLKSIIKQVGGKPALIGASMGGITSLIAEGESETSIASTIVLVDIAPKAEQKGIERIFAFMSANMDSGFATVTEAAEAVSAYLPHRPKTDDTGRLEKNLRFRNGRWFWHWDSAMLKVWQNTTVSERIEHEQRMFKAAQNLTVPTLIVRGGISDVVSERVMAEFLDAVPQVRSFTVAGAGHMVAGDSNHSFTNAVVDFLKEVYPANR